MNNLQNLENQEMSQVRGGYGTGSCLATIATTAISGAQTGAVAGGSATVVTGPFAGVGALAGGVAGGTLGITAGGIACLVGLSLGH